MYNSIAYNSILGSVTQGCFKIIKPQFSPWHPHIYFNKYKTFIFLGCETTVVTVGYLHSADPCFFIPTSNLDLVQCIPREMDSNDSSEWVWLCKGHLSAASGCLSNGHVSPPDQWHVKEVLPLLREKWHKRPFSRKLAFRLLLAVLARSHETPACFLFFFPLSFSTLAMEPRISHMLGKDSTLELHTSAVQDQPLKDMGTLGNRGVGWKSHEPWQPTGALAHLSPTAFWLFKPIPLARQTFRVRPLPNLPSSIATCPNLSLSLILSSVPCSLQML